MSPFICFSLGSCWQECEETDNGYAPCNGTIYSIKLEGLSITVENVLEKVVNSWHLLMHTCYICDHFTSALNGERGS